MNTPEEFLRIIAALQQPPSAARRAALLTLVGTQRPSFRRAGARMLVFENGEVVCPLSGGCPQEDMLRAAFEVIQTEQAQSLRYDAQQGMDLLLEQGCGGSLELCIEPLDTQHLPPALLQAAACVRQRQQGWLATRIGGHSEHSPRWLSSADALPDRQRSAFAAGVGPKPQRMRWQAEEWLLEPFQPPHAVVIVGDGPGVLSLLQIAELQGWQSWVLTDWHRRAPPAGLPSSTRLCHAQPGRLPADLPLDAQTSVLLMTHAVEKDLAWLRHFAAYPLNYLGVIGARHRGDYLRQASGLGALQLRTPAGLDIGGESPEALALSVMAEIQACRSGREGSPLSQGLGSIHP